MVSIGLGLPSVLPYKQILEYSILADEYGIDAIWLADSAPMPESREAFTTLAAIASQTSHLELCTGISNPYNRHVTLLAYMINNLQEISNGRFVFGLGAGSEASLGALGLNPPKGPLGAIRELVTILRKLFDGETINYQGQVHNVFNARLQPPYEIKTPIVIGGRGPKMIQLMGEIGDGALLEVPPKALPAAKSLLELGMKKSNRSFSDLVLYQWLPTVIGTNIEEYSMFTRWVTLFSITQTPDIINKAVSFPSEKIDTLRNILRKQGISDALNAVDKEMVETYGLIGSPSQIISKLETILDEGVHQVIFHYPFAKDPKEGIQLIGEEILPVFT